MVTKAPEIPTVYYNKKKVDETQLKASWWNLPQEEAHTHVMACAYAIESKQSYRIKKNVIHQRMYGNQLLATASQNIYAKPTQAVSQEAKLTLNVAKATVDTTTAKIAKNKPRTLFLTERGMPDQQRKAKKLTQYVDGVFKNARIYELGQTCFRDSGIFGTGFLKLKTETELGKIEAERVPPDEILVDDSDGIYGNPRTIYQRRYIHKEVVAEIWGNTPDLRDKILHCDEGGSQARPDRTDTGPMLYVVEAWHLPSSPNAKDGKRVIAIDSTILVWEDYEKSYFPIFRLYWTPPVMGFYGTGIIEEIMGLQLEINKLLRDLQTAQHRVCAPQIWIENGTQVTKPVTNEIGAVYRYSGQPPVFYAPSAMASEVYNHVWNLYRRAFEIVGVSEMSATLRKPAGLESRAALREYNDIETERFAIIAQAYERFYMDIAEAIVDMSRDMFTNNPDLPAKIAGKKFIETINWEDVDLGIDDYVMEVYPTSLLSNTPAGKLERVQEMMESGLIDRSTAMGLLDFPDVESVLNLEMASYNNISRIVDDILEDGKYTEPEAFMDLQQALKITQNAYLKAQTEGESADRLELLRRLAKKILSMLVASNPPAPPAPSAGPAQGPISPEPIMPEVPGPVPPPM